MDAFDMTSPFAFASFGNEEQERRRLEEEEETDYPETGAGDDWEYKILRCYFGEFRNFAKRQQILNEEARAGWQLVELLDMNRMRLKRPTGARANDGDLDFDPYRIEVGDFTRMALVFVALGVVVAVGVIGAIVARM